ncbi:MAG TPA: PAS domain-containing sensor histidine kinase [bacterium]|nr:PAS domain-containing sensor histidine kinase [bacterium]
MTFWMRILLVWVLILFGSYAQSFKPEKNASSLREPGEGDDRLIMVSLLFGIGYWLLVSFRHELLQNTSPSLDRWLHSVFRPDPAEFWIRALAVLLLFLFGIYAQDLTNKRRNAARAIRENENRLRQIIIQMPYPVMVCDTEGRALMINRCYQKLFKVSSEKIVDQYNVTKNENWERLGLAEIIQRAFQGETVHIPKIVIDHQEDFHGFASDETRILEGTLFPVFCQNSRIRHIVTIWQEVTHQILAEEEKDKIHAQLLQAQKMEAIGILAGGVAHDFNNLLTAIQGNADLTLLDINDKSPHYRDLKQIKIAAGRAADLTKQLLLFSRKHLMGFSLLNLNQSIEGLLTMIRRLIGENIMVKTNLSSDLWTVKADRGTLEQVVMNLVVNARDAMPLGGRLTISTGNIKFKDIPVHHMGKASSGAFVCLSVTDSGIGMEKKTIQHIFEPFFSTKEPGSGTGLGLSVVYGIVKQHGGWINVYSEPDHGSTFKVYLPAIMKKAEKTHNDPSITIKALQGNGERVLVVEDDINVRNFIVSALDRAKYDVISAGSYEEAMNVFESEKHHFQMVLSDVVLPDRTGIDLVDAMLNINPNIRVLLGSGYMDEKSQWPVIQERGYRFLQKPYALMDLLRNVKSCLQSKPHKRRKVHKNEPAVS